MTKYRCEGCAIYCQCEIMDACIFRPKVCLAQLDERYFEHYEPKWIKLEDDAEGGGE